MFDNKPDYFFQGKQNAGHQPIVLEDNDTQGSKGLDFSGVLTFVLADMTVFSLLFCAFLIDRSSAIDLFTAGTLSLDLAFGLFNTIVLIVSGVFMVLAVNAAKEKNIKATRRNLLFALLVGFAFGISKIFEYSAKFELGLDITTNEFYMYYFALTGAHFLHFLGGVGAIIVLLILGKSDEHKEAYFGHVESAGIYWHMVDLLWLVIFPLLYLLV